MDHNHIIENLNANSDIFLALLKDKNQEEYEWKPNANKWSLLEVVCHLYDEEREDFRARVMSILENPDLPLAGFDPFAWVKDRKYMEKDYKSMVSNFLEERTKSINWLRSLKNPSWKNVYKHPELDPLSAEHFLANWLAHDILHIRQILKIQYNYLKYKTKKDLNYAGIW